MNYNEAIEKAVKLLRLATSSNPNEAALAASRAQEIIDRFKLGSLSLDYASNGNKQADEPIKDFGLDPLDQGTRKLASWRWRLFCAIGKQNQCKGYLSRLGGIAIVGRPSDVSTVRYFYAWLTREVNRIADRDCRGNGRIYANNYRIGVVDTVAVRLKEQAAQTVVEVKREAELQLGDFLALVRVNQAVATLEKRYEEVGDWMKSNLKLGRGTTTRFVQNFSARQAGQIAGQSIRLKPATAQIG